MNIYFEDIKMCFRKWGIRRPQLAAIAIQLAAFAFMSLEGPNTHGSASPDPGLVILDFMKNRSVFKLVFEA